MRLIQRLSVLTALVCLLPAIAFAQDTTGSISGTVTHIGPRGHVTNFLLKGEKQENPDK